MPSKPKSLPLILPPDLYARLVEVAAQQDRLPYQQAIHFIRRCLAEIPDDRPGAV